MLQRRHTSFQRVFTVFLKVAFSMIVFVGQAQVVDRNEIIRQLGEPVLFGEIIHTSQQVHGTPFFNDEWARGDIYLANGQVASGMLKYNGFEDELYWFDPAGNRTVVLDRVAVDGFTLRDATSGKPLTFRKMLLGRPALPENERVFLHVLYEGDISLYVHRRIEERGRRVAYRNGRRVELPNLEARPVYYVDIPGIGMVQVQRMRKSFFYDLVPGQREAIREALSEHPGRLRSEDSLKEAVISVDRIYSFLP